MYGVVASPVKHSMSPAIHNAGFDAIGHDGVYLPMLVEASYESFKAFIETFRDFPGLNLSGLSITIPHKENALRYLKEKSLAIEPLAEQIGAVNTFIFDESGIRGINTDYAAILDTITTALSIQREQLAGLRVAVLGAGGTGRTAVAALAAYGADRPSSTTARSKRPNRWQPNSPAKAGKWSPLVGKSSATPAVLS